MTQVAPILDAITVEGIIRAGLPMAELSGFKVESVGPSVATVRLGYRPWMLRPGGTVAGPVLILAADAAMYAVILAHVGEQVMAVTSDMTIHFLNKPQPGDVIAEARLLKLGRRLVVVRVAIRSEGSDTLIAEVIGSYALPHA